MAAPIPTGIQARFANSWVYLTVPRAPGYSAEVEAYQNGQWEPVQRWGAEYPIALYAHGAKTEWRARYTRSGAPGGWRTGRAWVPDQFEEDGDVPPPPPNPYPEPPSGLVVTGTDAALGTATVAWANPHDERVTYWRVLLEGDTHWRTAHTDSYTFRNLTVGTSYGWRVKAVHEDSEGYTFESGASRGPEFDLDDTQPPPEPLRPPQGLTVHCITTKSGKAEWQQDPAAEDWEIWLDDDRFDSFVTSKTLVALTGLSAETTYRVNVVARGGEPGTPGYRESEPAVETFTTLGDEEKPPPPPPPIEGDLPAPTNLVVRADSPSSVLASWDDARPSSADVNFYYASVDRRRWQRVDAAEARFEGLEAGREYTVDVFGVFGKQLTSLARKATTVRGAR